MAVAVADLERVKREDPDYGLLVTLVDRGLDRMRLPDGKRMSDAQLGEDAGFSTAVIYDLRKHRKRPGRDLLIALADLFNDSREEWLAAGGYDIESLPQDRGFTTAERTIARLFAALSENDKAVFLQELAERERQAPQDRYTDR